jgi:hypothetical protein
MRIFARESRFIDSTSGRKIEPTPGGESEGDIIILAIGSEIFHGRSVS